MWLERWKGASPAKMPDWVSAPALPALRATLAAIDAELAAYLSTVTDADLVKPVAYTLFNGKPSTQALGAQLRHLANHGTYHRGQIAGMLRQVGATPTNTDFITFIRKAG